MSERVQTFPYPGSGVEFPTPEDWRHVQAGGMPRVFHNPARPQSRWLVLHVYDEHGDAEQRFQSGLVVDTLPEHTSNLGFYPIPKHTISYENGAVDEIPERTVAMPTFMLRALHGEVCEARSREHHGEGYPRIKNQMKYVQFVRDLQAKRFHEIRFAMDVNRWLYLRSEPHIREPRPLAQTT